MGTQVRQATLLPVGNVSGARGQALTMVLPDGSQHFQLEAEGLQPDTGFDILLDGSTLATVTSGDDGELEAFFGAPPREREALLPSSFLPVSGVKQVELQGGGQTVLSGTFSSPGGSGGGGQSPTSFTFEILHLTPTSAAPAEAEGVAMTRYFQLADGSTRQDLKVSVDGLLPGTTYEVVIDGTNAGTISTDHDGDGHLFLSTQDIPGAEPLPSALQPVTGLKHIEVQDKGGTAVLTGDFANARVIQQNRPEGEYLAVAVLRDGSGRPIGMAMARSDSSEEQVAVEARHLSPNTSYRIVLDGTTAGTVQTDGEGKLEVVFSSNPEGDEMPLPSALQPVSGLMHVEIQDGGGNAVASGDFRAAGMGAATVHHGLTRRRLGHH